MKAVASVLSRKFVPQIESSSLDRSIVPQITRALNILPSRKSANLPTCHFREAEANLLSFFEESPPDLRHELQFHQTSFQCFPISHLPRQTGRQLCVTTPPGKSSHASGRMSGLSLELRSAWRFDSMAVGCVSLCSSMRIFPERGSWTF